LTTFVPISGRFTTTRFNPELNLTEVDFEEHLELIEEMPWSDNSHRPKRNL